MKDTTNFKVELVSKIEGEFYIADYQRGYRWGTEEVERLLEDIYLNGERNKKKHEDNKYCLQPIVVKKKNNQFELIDGQQRLTTIYLIYQYMHKRMPEEAEKPQFFIDYNQAREQTREFLQEVDFAKENDNIDFYFISNAYKTINNWFSDKETKKSAVRFFDYLTTEVKIIWYEVDESVDSNRLFTRLNIGKIPLTSSELVKAMFLSKDSNEQIDSEKQNEIALQWDNIESELQDDKFWYFLTNRYTGDYPTRIDLILDLMTGKTEKNQERYYTFYAIKNMNISLDELWKKIYHTFLLLKDWFENHELYHKIGYLITTKSMTLQQIYVISNGKKKDEFRMLLNRKIKESLSNCNFDDCDYSNEADCKKMLKLLTLFNIETVRKNGEQTQWFPFDKFKISKGEKNIWSLEHIHAQNSKDMPKEAWNEWLKLHLEALTNLAEESSTNRLIEEVKEWIDNPKLTGEYFNQLKDKILEKFTPKTSYSQDSIANLALLNFKDNSALSNSTFDVKRNKIIEMDQKGHYIPFCTRMVFFKYYTPSQENQLHFWGQRDMEAYIHAINDKLAEYLAKEIKAEKEI